MAIGFIANILLSNTFGEERINNLMKKIGVVLLFIFIPLLVFKLFLNIDFKEEQIDFTILSCIVMAFLYIIAYLYAIKKSKKIRENGRETQFIKTVIVNQGRGAAFVGSAMLAIEEIRVSAAIYITLLGIFLFALIPYVLSLLHKKEIKGNVEEQSPLPLHIRVFPWYLLIFPISAVIIHSYTGITTTDSSDNWERILNLLAAITIPAALYYVGSGIRVKDLSKTELKKLFFGKDNGYLTWVREIIFLTLFITPVIVAIIFGTLLIINLIPLQWFVVLILNAILPISSTHMFLVPYGINKKVTALSITWTTVFSIPIFVLLLYVFSFLFT